MRRNIQDLLFDYVLAYPIWLVCKAYVIVLRYRFGRWLLRWDAEKILTEVMRNGDAKSITLTHGHVCEVLGDDASYAAVCRLLEHENERVRLMAASLLALSLPKSKWEAFLGDPESDHFRRVQERRNHIYGTGNPTSA